MESNSQVYDDDGTVKNITRGENREEDLTLTDENEKKTLWRGVEDASTLSEL